MPQQFFYHFPSSKQYKYFILCLSIFSNASCKFLILCLQLFQELQEFGLQCVLNQSTEEKLNSTKNKFEIIYISPTLLIFINYHLLHLLKWFRDLLQFQRNHFLHDLHWSVVTLHLHMMCDVLWSPDCLYPTHVTAGTMMPPPAPLYSTLLADHIYANTRDWVITCVWIISTYFYILNNCYIFTLLNTSNTDQIDNLVFCSWAQI